MIKPWCIFENILPYLSYTVRDDDGSQATAILESIGAHPRHTVGNGDGGQATAILESPVADSRHIVGKSDGGQTCATIESIVANARHAITCTIISDGFRNDNISCVIIANHTCSMIISVKRILDVINNNILRHATDTGQQQA